VLTDYAISIAETCQVATLHGIQVTATIMGNGAFIDLARNRFVEMFLEKEECTHLFFIDADLKWEPRAFIGLLQAGRPICAGVYPKRQDPEEFPCRWQEHKDGGLWVEDGWVMCDRVPTGFLCIERDLVREIHDRSPKIVSSRDPEMRRLFYTYINSDSMFVGEDFAFCEDYVKHYGRPIPVWPDFDFTHGVKWSGNWHAFLNKQIEAGEAAEQMSKAA
jgi:hypothetical protein